MSEDTIEAARLSRSYCGLRIVVFLAVMAAAIGLGATLSRNLEGLPLFLLGAAVVLGLVVALGALAIARNVCVLRAPPFIRLTPQGIHLRLRRLGAIGLLLPTPRFVEVHVPWTDFACCRTRTTHGGGVPAENSLIIERISSPGEKGAVCVDCGAAFQAFGKSPEGIMTSILSFFDARVRQPALEALGIAQVAAQGLRERFREPLEVRLRLNPGALKIAGVPLLVGGLFLCGWAVHLCVQEEAATAAFWILGVLGLLATLCGVAALWGYRADSPQGTVVIRAEGLAIGPSVAQAKLYPWEKITGSHVIWVYRTYGPKEGEADRLEIVLRDGAVLTLRDRYDRPLTELAELISPGAARRPPAGPGPRMEG